MGKKRLKLFFTCLLILVITAVYILLELRIIQKPYKWIIFNVTRNKYTTYDKDTDTLIYRSEDMDINIEHIVKEEPNLEMWIATIKIADSDQIKSAFAGGEFSQDIKKRTSVIAKDINAVLAIDGSAVGFNDNGRIIRDGIIYRDSDLDCEPLIIKENGDFVVYQYGEKTAQEILDLGGVETYDFGPTLIKDNEILDIYGEWYKTVKDSRTVIGQKGPLEYVILVADGRSEKSEGISLYDAALELKNKGCYIGYNLDGGGSSTIYFNGEVLNNPSDIIGERRISDILYFKEN